MALVPIIDISSFIDLPEENHEAVVQIRQACRRHGFFYISGHQISIELQAQLAHISKRFFEQPEAIKLGISMKKAMRTWRGYFPLGDELTSGKPDMKEGLYFGIQHPREHPKVRTQTIMHGQNQFPENIPGFENTVNQYMAEMTVLGHRLMGLLSLSLGLPIDYFENSITKDPWTLFRIFHYPSMTSEMPEDSWGVGEHTDYGVLTILKQDEIGGLQIKSNDIWIEAPYIENTFICNLGDMFSKMTGGYFQATPHRVKNRSNLGRYSFPFFFDPGWDTKVTPVKSRLFIHHPESTKPKRWDNSNPELFNGTYGEYISMKIGRVFPDLI